MLIKNKKGSTLPLYVALVVLMSFLMILISIPNLKEDVDPLGKNPYSILEANQEAENVYHYMEMSLEYSSNQAILELPKKVEELKNDFSGGLHVHPIYSDENGFCGPNYEQLFKDILSDNFYRYLSLYDAVRLFSYKYSVNVEQLEGNDKIIHSDKSKPLKIELFSDKDSKIKIPIGLDSDNFKKDTIFYPSGPYGGCGNEIIKTCEYNDCIADTAKSFYDLYTNSNILFNYVWGGESPYTYEDSVDNGKCADFFDEGVITLKEPKRYKLTERGFDCSGWVWWIGKHANLTEFNDRLTANQYYLNAQKDGNVIWSKKEVSEELTFEKIYTDLIPGDILFSKRTYDDEITHVMIYIGEGEIIHSRSSKGLIKEEIPNTDNYNLVSQIQAVVRYLEPKPKTEEETEISENTYCNINNFYSNFINEEQIKSNNGEYKRPPPEEQFKIINELYDDLQTSEEDTLNYVISEYSRQEGVPEAFVRAIMATETGTKYLREYLQKHPNQEKCNEVGYCGLMQFGSSACSDVNGLNSNECDFEIAKTDLHYSLKKGIDYLKILSTSKSYKDCVESRVPVEYETEEELSKLIFTDYYFLALAYNAGGGSCTQIKKQAYLNKNPSAVKTEIESDDLRLINWGDITYDVVKDGMKNQYYELLEKAEDKEKAKKNNAWMLDPKKWDEIFEYPNLVANALKQQCGGDLSLMYNTGYFNSNNYVELKPNFKNVLDFDLKKYLSIRSFIEDLNNNCVNEDIKNCINETIEENSYPGFFFYHLSDYFNIKDYNFYLQKTNQEIIEDAFGESFVGGLEEVGTQIVDAFNDNMFQTKNSFKDDFVDQMFDCHNNMQTNCVCKLDFDLSKLQEDTIFGFTKNEGNYVANLFEKVNHFYLIGDDIETIYLPFNPLLEVDGENINSYYQIIFNFEKDKEDGNITLSAEFIQDLNSINPRQWNVDDIENLPFALYKNESGDLNWYYYENKPSDPIQCMDRKQYYRFSAKNYQNGLTQFSVFLNDTKLPKLDNAKLESKELFCLNNNATLLKWYDFEPSEELYAFKLFVLDGTNIQSKIIPIYQTKMFDANSLDRNIILNTLYYDENENAFYYPINKINDLKLEVEKEYSFAIAGVDHFNLSQDNLEGLSEQKFSIKENQLAETFTETLSSYAPVTEFVGTSNLLDMYCKSPDLFPLPSSIVTNEMQCCSDPTPTPVELAEVKLDE